MSNFVRDNTTLPNGKTDLVPLGGGDDPTKNLTAAEWNTAMQAAIDLRGWVKTGLTGGTFAMATLVVDADGRITGVSANQAAANSITGNNTGALAARSDLTGAQVTAMLNVFTSLLQGLVPASAGGIVNFLRADGNWKPAGLLGVQLLTGTSGTYTPTPGTTRALVWQFAAGGGGGGVGATNVAVGGGGASGAQQLTLVGTAGTALTGGAFTHGASASGGSTAGGNGGNGADSTLVAGGTTLTTKGGLGGTGDAGSAAAHTVSGGGVQAGTGATGGTFQVLFTSQSPGHPGLAPTSTFGWGGSGGPALPAGAATVDTLGGNAGAAGSGFGSGGAGACGVGVGKAGGASAPGATIVIEFA